MGKHIDVEEADMLGLVASPWQVIVGYALVTALYAFMMRDIAHELRGE